MKTFTILFIMAFTLFSCAPKKARTKSQFKLVMGQAAVLAPMIGGIFVETEDQATRKKTIIKLDQDNSANIPTGVYTLLFVAFQGPGPKSGPTFCGSTNANLASPNETMTVSITSARCSEEIFITLIAKILGSAGTWDTSLFDQGTWGP